MIRFRLKSADGTVLAEKVVSRFPFTVGRSSASGLAVGDAGVSGTHAELDWDGHHLHLRDRNSRNGTFVDGSSVSEMVLNLPCVFRLGSNVTVEAETAEPEVHRLPTVFRMATPQPSPHLATQPAQPADPTPELGEERYWHRLQDLPPRTAAFAGLAIGGLIFFVELAVFRESIAGSLVIVIEALLGSLIFGAVCGAMLALPGMVFEGRYRFKPLFLQLAGSFLLMALELALQPAILMPYAGVLVRLACLPLLLAVCLTGPYVFLFSTFPHRHARRLFQVSIAFAVISSGVQVFQLVTLSQRTLLRSAFLGTFRASRGLAGSTQPVSALTDELRGLGSGRAGR